MLGYAEGQLPAKFVEGRPALVDVFAFQLALLATKGHLVEEGLDGLLMLLAEDGIDDL